MLFETKKSKNSKKLESEEMICTSDKRLKPNNGSKHIEVITTKLINTDFTRLILNNYMVPAIELSNTAIIVDTAAINMNRKNKAPQNAPKVIFENTMVIDTNNKFGPASGEIP